MRFCRQGPSLVVHTPAKLNLFLEVRGRRPDGYHELETIMVSIDLFDTLRFTPDQPGAVSLLLRPISSPASAGLPADDRNLVVQAARLLGKHCGIRGGVAIELTKRIPLESGLGGGSSDAAATLVALNRLWHAGLSRDELHALAAQLGSDVNFFLDSRTAAMCLGRGERVQTIPLPRRLHFVVLRPPGGLPTAAVFRRLELQVGEVHPDGRDVADLRAALRDGASARIGRCLHNSLEQPARELNEDVAGALHCLRKQPLPGAAMSGSGTACFALCRSAKQARFLAARLRTRIGNHVWSVSSCN